MPKGLDEKRERRLQDLQDIDRIVITVADKPHGSLGYDNGQAYAVTLGEFISILVDAGQDPAVIFRVVEDGPPDETGGFVRKFEVIMVPDGHVIEEMKVQGVHRIHKVLRALLDAGKVS